MDRTFFLWAGIAVILFAVFGLRSRGGAQAIDGADAHRRVAGGGVLIDVRSPGEFAAGHLPNARNIPVGEIGAHLNEIPRDRDVIVYCASGMRSARAARVLRSNGFVRVFDLGSLSNW